MSYCSNFYLHWLSRCVKKIISVKGNERMDNEWTFSVHSYHKSHHSDKVNYIPSWEWFSKEFTKLQTKFSSKSKLTMIPFYCIIVTWICRFGSTSKEVSNTIIWVEWNHQAYLYEDLAMGDYYPYMIYSNTCKRLCELESWWIWSN